MIRALFVLQGPDFICGPNVWLTRHLPLLRGHGIEPRVLYLATDPDVPCRFRSALAAQGIPSRGVAIGRFTELAVRDILQALAEERPQIFVPNCSAPAYFASRVAREAGIRTIGVLHSDDPFYHDIVDHFIAGDERWRMEGVVTVSDYLHDVARATATASTRVCHATYGAPVDGDPRAETEADDFTMLYVGRFAERQKRILRVAERFCAAARAVPGVQAVLYGDGPEDVEVRALVDRAGLGDRVRVAGPLPPDAVMPTMRQAQAFVLLSDFEGLAIALMEAMASGLVPIISALRSGTSELIEHDVNALVVDADDEASFVDAVRRLRHEPGLRARLSAAARETMLARGFTPEECARRWADLCQAVASPEPVRDVRLPTADELTLELPLPSARPFGFRILDRRNPQPILTRAVGDGRPVYVWGAGSGGRQFLASAAVGQRGVAGIIDRRAGVGAEPIDGVAVYPPQHLVHEARREPRPFVAIASMYDLEIAQELEQLGFRPQSDFVSV